MTKISKNIEEAAKLLQKGEVVAIPTETVYGLGADATNDEAVAKIFLAKGRPSDNPLIVHIGSLKQLEPIVSDISSKAKQLMDAFWPGPLTVILPKGEGISQRVSAGLDTIGVRMPNHPIALKIIQQSGLPIAAPSANTSGRPSPTTANHVQEDLKGKIPLIIDGGNTGVGVESTVIDCSTEPPMILRPGGVSQEEIEGIIGKVMVDEALSDMANAPKSPGMKYAHYAPKAPLHIVEGSNDFLQEQIKAAQDEGLKVGVLGTVETQKLYDADVVLACGSQKDILTVAYHLYETLRKFDEHELDLIFSESFSEKGLGQAVMNRLIKAAGHQIIKESDSYK